MMTSRINIADPNVGDDQLCTRQECADFLRITAVSWDRLTKLGKAPEKVTPEGVWPRWRVGDIRAYFKIRQQRSVAE